MKVLTAAQMRECDRIGIEELGLAGIVLMENAGRTTYQILRQEFPELIGPTVVVAGRGNNGGDGFVVARYLANAGQSVAVLLLASWAQVSGDARVNLELLRQLQVPVYEITHEEALLQHLPRLQRSSLIVDAILGTGLNSEVKGLYRQAIELINRAPAPVLAIDIPSGLSADTGQPLGIAVRAQVTVTYGWPKLGQILPPGRDLVGRLWQVDISLPPQLAALSSLELAEPAILRALLPPRPQDSHKGTFGHLLVIGGSVGKTGAAALAGEGALRVGAGLVTVAVPASLNPILEVKLTEAMTAPLAEVPGHGALSQAAWQDLEELWPGKTAVALGPGLGRHPETVALVQRLVRERPLPLVVDADGLYALAQDLNGAPGPTPLVLTPHPGEMARLLGCTTREVQTGRLPAAQELAQRTGAVVVLKGAQTLVADPDGRMLINTTGNPALAQGGTGDVLTGMIGGLLAQGLEPFAAAGLGVYLHGLAADSRAAWQGTRGMLAGELLDELPEVIHKFAAGEIPVLVEQPCCKLVIS